MISKTHVNQYHQIFSVVLFFVYYADCLHG